MYLLSTASRDRFLINAGCRPLRSLQAKPRCLYLRVKEVRCTAALQSFFSDSESERGLP